eukprot:CAMPEP_0194064598 /NCGR_PEP_ID=MMETSP0009_2-20130614/83480_1 /TAXON_ID=210454 /ORGANISM="Grammatophora oceanica, Strain CCMP 410" /LENGTH=136 /DNA_ID=CAMNT_0038717139 /DNA_START=106 /DNA_END=516 /DNA_ORIENTATION=-
MSSTTTTPITTGVSHVGLTVSKYEKSIAFFESIGFKQVGGDKSYPSTFLSDGSVMITLWKTQTDTPEEFDRKTNVGLHHLALKVPSLEALQKAYDTATAVEGVVSEFAPQAIAGMPLHHAMVYDPSGIRIEFTFHA